MVDKAYAATLKLRRIQVFCSHDLKARESRREVDFNFHEGGVEPHNRATQGLR
jgi:hypothetical protein